MRITVDGNVVEAVNRVGSEIWDFANGEVRQLSQDYSSGHLVFKTYAILVQAKVEAAANLVANTVESVANTVDDVKKTDQEIQEAQSIEQDLKKDEGVIHTEANTLIGKAESELKHLEEELVDGLKSVEGKIKAWIVK